MPTKTNIPRPPDDMQLFFLVLIMKFRMICHYLTNIDASVIIYHEFLWINNRQKTFAEWRHMFLYTRNVYFLEICCFSCCLHVNLLRAENSAINVLTPSTCLRWFLAGHPISSEHTKRPNGLGRNQCLSLSSKHSQPNSNTCSLETFRLNKL